MEHIVAKNALSTTCIAVAINKSTDRRIIESALEVVERGFSVLCVPLVEEWKYLLVCRWYHCIQIATSIIILVYTIMDNIVKDYYRKISSIAVIFDWILTARVLLQRGEKEI